MKCRIAVIAAIAVLLQLFALQAPAAKVVAGHHMPSTAP